MAILNFQKRFADKVRRGIKQQTIRAFRKYPIEFGERLYLYTGLRTKLARKLRGEAWCIGTRFIEITEVGITIYYKNTRPDRMVARSRSLARLNRFAVADGFKDWAEMKAFWLETHGLPFEGTLIKWVDWNPNDGAYDKD